MPDFGREIKFGNFIVPTIGDPLIETALEVERLGLDYVAIQDHPYLGRFVDTWTLLAMIAGATSRVGMFPDVANLPLRSPAGLAKAAATLDMLSGGRFELGLGAGAFWDAIEAFGGPRRTPAEAIEALAEGIKVIREVWRGEKGLQFQGKFYQLQGAEGGPKPAHDIGIWLGTYKPRALRLTGRLADGWVPSYRPDMPPVVDMVGRVDEAAAAAGRDPGVIRRILNVRGEITGGETRGMFQGPADHWADELTNLAVTHGFDTFIFWGDGNEQLRRFAEEVVPAVRSEVAHERGR